MVTKRDRGWEQVPLVIHRSTHALELCWDSAEKDPGFPNNKFDPVLVRRGLLILAGGKKEEAPHCPAKRNKSCFGHSSDGTWLNEVGTFLHISDHHSLHLRFMQTPKAEPPRRCGTGAVTACTFASKLQAGLPTEGAALHQHAELADASSQLDS